MRLFCRKRYHKGIIFGYENGVMWSVMFACVALFNKINDDNRRAIVNQERTWFSF